MASRALVLLLVLLPGGLSTLFAQPQAAPESILADIRNGAAFRFQIHPTLPTYVFRLVPAKDPNWTVIERIEVFREGTPGVLQVLENEPDEPPPNIPDYFQSADYNFDGYADIRLLNNWGATGNQIFSHWLFEPKTGRFVPSKELDEIFSPAPDPKTKQLTTHWRGGGMSYTLRRYVWEGGKPALVYEEEQGVVAGTDRLRKVIKERRQGKLVVTREEAVPQQ
jgi:hypothetical protein